MKFWDIKRLFYISNGQMKCWPFLLHCNISSMCKCFATKTMHATGNLSWFERLSSMHITCGKKRKIWLGNTILRTEWPNRMHSVCSLSQYNNRVVAHSYCIEELPTAKHQNVNKAIYAVGLNICKGMRKCECVCECAENVIFR